LPALLGELVDIDGKTALKVRGLILVDNADFCELVNHRIDLRSFLLSRFLIGCIAEITDSVPRRLCIILVMQSMPFVLTNGLLSRFCVCHYFIFYIL